MPPPLPDVPASFFHHLVPAHAPGQAGALEALAERARLELEAHLASGLRTVEAMLLELQHVLLAHPDVVQVSFDQDGDPSNYPQFSCCDAQGQDLAEDYGAGDEVAQRWLSSQHPVAASFLVEAEGRVFTREGWPGQVRALALKLGHDHLGLTAQQARAWADSLERHFVAQGLDARLPAGGAARPRPRA